MSRKTRVLKQLRKAMRGSPSIAKLPVALYQIVRMHNGSKRARLKPNGSQRWYYKVAKQRMLARGQV